jgi:hypothetical protein
MEGTMTIISGKSLAWAVMLAGALGTARSLDAQIPVGTWVRQPTKSMPGVESRFDGSDAPVLMNGKPSGETMGIKLVDDHHASTVLKMNGTIFGTADGTLSPDGKTLTVIDDYNSAAGGQPVGKHTELWTRK